MLSQSTLLHNMRNTADLDNKLISRAISGLRTRLPSNWRMEVEAQPASSVGVLDALLSLCFNHGEFCDVLETHRKTLRSRSSLAQAVFFMAG